MLEQWASLHGRMTEAVRKKFQRMSIVRSRVAADPGGKPPITTNPTDWHLADDR
jgi:hypothetical protein